MQKCLIKMSTNENLSENIAEVFFLHLQVTAMRFFLGTMENENSDDSSGSEQEADEDQKTLKEVKLF